MSILTKHPPSADESRLLECGEPRPRLTPRELEVVRLVIDGLSNKEIAARLFVSGRTVQAHIAAATGKTGTRTRTQLAVYALRTGLVPGIGGEDGWATHRAA